jgi:hypothetical protein
MSRFTIRGGEFLHALQAAAVFHALVHPGHIHPRESVREDVFPTDIARLVAGSLDKGWGV